MLPERGLRDPPHVPVLQEPRRGAAAQTASPGDGVLLPARQVPHRGELGAELCSHRQLHRKVGRAPSHFCDVCVVVSRFCRGLVLTRVLGGLREVAGRKARRRKAFEPCCVGSGFKYRLTFLFSCFMVGLCFRLFLLTLSAACVFFFSFPVFFVLWAVAGLFWWRAFHPASAWECFFIVYKKVIGFSCLT